jgi:hypothetical protein
MAAKQRFSLWWAVGAWAVFSLVVLNLHQWAIRNRDVAEVLLILYGSTVWAGFTWLLAQWVDREKQRRASRS